MPTYKLLSPIKEADAELRKQGYEFDNLVADHVMATMIYRKGRKQAEIRVWCKHEDMEDSEIFATRFYSHVLHFETKSSLKLERIVY